MHFSWFLLLGALIGLGLAFEGRKRVLYFTIVGSSAFIGLVVVDQKFGPVLPDSVYCFIGAGTELHQPARSYRTGGTAPDWEYTDAVTLCIHRTLWDAWSREIGLKNAEASEVRFNALRAR
jgi:hypothetical protein